MRCMCIAAYSWSRNACLKHDIQVSISCTLCNRSGQGLHPYLNAKYCTLNKLLGQYGQGRGGGRVY